MDAHLPRCGKCRLEAARLQACAAAAQPRPCALGEILKKVRARERDLSGARIRDIKSRVARELVPYLGSPAAERVLERVAGEGQDLLSRIESVLALFLGGRAAGELAGRIVDTAIVRS